MVPKTGIWPYNPGVFDDVFEVSEKADTGRKEHENMAEASENAATPGPRESKAREDKPSVQSPQILVQDKTPVGLFSILPQESVFDVPFRERNETKSTGKAAILTESPYNSSLLDSVRKTPKRKLFDYKQGCIHPLPRKIISENLNMS
ncbi:hypothetical protein ILUMI_23688 [Ignelater luminosus]|uniref:Uncharacterized protein n=1 Tax=Ignelater luminosus TaxID=2038154 RepID=A0A8K0G1M3_IGNLU|nr:hypothetical protein ILUMI_23688 [Ignelater luminosus]